MRFYDVLVQTIGLLALERCVTYQALKRQFDIDDAYIADLKIEIINLRQLARDHEGLMLVWTGEGLVTPVSFPIVYHRPAQHISEDPHHIDTIQPPMTASTSQAERRQLTVMFCDLVDSTRLAGQLDPEDWREVVRAYQEQAAGVIQQYEGYIAQYLGDGLLVYFGWPRAHEDDAHRAVHTGLGIVEAVDDLNTTLATAYVYGLDVI